MKPPQFAALRGEARVAQHVGHEGGEGVGDLGHSEAGLAGREGEAVAGQRRRDHRERVGRGRRRSVRGSVSIGRILWNSHTEPGQPWESSSGSGRGPRPSSWMKWRSMPATLALNWRKRVSAAPRARASRSGPSRGDQVLHVGEARAEGPLLARRLGRARRTRARRSRRSASTESGTWMRKGSGGIRTPAFRCRRRTPGAAAPRSRPARPAPSPARR